MGCRRRLVQLQLLRLTAGWAKTASTERPETSRPKYTADEGCNSLPGSFNRPLVKWYHTCLTCRYRGFDSLTDDSFCGLSRHLGIEHRTFKSLPPTGLANR